jgi:glutathione peroxidase
MKTNRRYYKLKLFLIIFCTLAFIFISYVEIVNRNTVNMTSRQKILKAVYPAFMWFNRLTGRNTKGLSNDQSAPPVSFYSLKGIRNDGTIFDFSQLKGKQVMLVNTASDCGYTNQYEGLQKLHERFADKLVLIGFPANDFKEQEKGTDESIASFCKQNFGISFPLMKKSSVVKGPGQNEIFSWLTDPAKNGWNDQAPGWNFCKYLVDSSGRLTHYFPSSVEPMSGEILSLVNK